jgi:hypothetical protein
MKVIINEKQLENLILEETLGLDNFLLMVVDKFPQCKDYIDVIQEFIVNSNCRRIEVGKVNGAFGVSLSDRVLISDTCFKQPFEMFLFILFHEIAHQYQYKKYGEEKMYEIYLGEISLEEGANWMKQIEIIADEFATRKVRQLQKMGAIPIDTKIFKSFYQNIPINHFIGLITKIKSELKRQNVTNPSEVSEIIYNWVRPII